ncbi:M12 family metallo-peptidase [Oligoflexia bacterium]|nr:M12 family metallo-peptidase [Oligoflexia bacterium]
MKRLLTQHLLIALTLALVSLPAPSQAESSQSNSSLRQPLLLNSKHLEQINRFHARYATSDQDQERFITLKNPLTIKAGIPFVGRVRFVFNKLRYFRFGERYIINEHGEAILDESLPPLLLRGFVEKQGERIASIAGSVQNEELIIDLLRDQRGRYVDLRAALVKGRALSARYHRESLRSKREAACAHTDEEHSLVTAPALADEASAADASISLNAETAAATYKIVELAIEADYEYFQAQGSDQTSTTSAIAAHFNTVEALYESELQVTFDITSQIVYTSSSQPYTTGETSGLLDELASATYGLGADLKHLLTGKDIYAASGGSYQYGVAGVAYLGVLCTSTMSNVGISEHFSSSSLNTVITTHELGHNFGANHSSEYSIMYPSATTAPEYQFFASDSLASINGHLSSYGNCLANGSDDGGSDDDDDTGGATGTVQLTLNVDKSSGEVTLYTNYSEAMTGCTLELALSTKKSMSNSRSLGTFSATGSNDLITAKKKKKVSSGKAYAQATLTCDSGTITSDVKRFKGIKKIDSSKAIASSKWIKLKKVALAM